MTSSISVPDDTFGRGRPASEVFNIASHAAGVILAVAGLVFLVSNAKGPLQATAFAVYGATLILLFLASAAYHFACAMGHENGVFRRIDHSAIFLFIAGTYTPPCLLVLPPGWGWSIFGVVWSLALAGIVVKVFLPFTPRWVTVGMYVGLGWIAILGVPIIVQAVSWGGVALLFAGGVLYTLGAVVYATGRPNVLPSHVGAHGVFHVMVLLASLAHYLFMAGYVLLAS